MSPFWKKSRPVCAALVCKLPDSARGRGIAGGNPLLKRLLFSPPAWPNWNMIRGCSAVLKSAVLSSNGLPY